MANIGRWLNEPGYESFAGLLGEHLTGGKWPELEAAFWTVLPFGTAGRRGPMYPIGTATINDRTVGERRKDWPISSAGTCPTTAGRGRRSLMTPATARGISPSCVQRSWRPRASPFIFWMVFAPRPSCRSPFGGSACQAGIMVSASHNPPQDNAVKVFGPSGGQLRPPDDERLTARWPTVSTIGRVDFATAAHRGRILFCQDEMDREYQAAVLAQSFAGPRDLHILYSPLHGVGLWVGVAGLEADGFSRVTSTSGTPRPTAIFPTFPITSPIPKMRLCSTS